MTSIAEVVMQARCRDSLERSRSRRQAARLERRKKLRLRGGSLSLMGVLLVMGSTGAALSVADRVTVITGAAKVEVTLRAGDRGPAVASVQRKLRLNADGVFGPLTHGAVKRFQRRKGLVADGIVGPATRAALDLPPFSLQSVVHPKKPKRPVRDAGGSGGLSNLPAALVLIAECESGGDPTAVSSSGRYRGKYQFMRSTWKEWGGRGDDPAKAPESHQDGVALRLYRARGTAPWPNCGG